MSIRDLTVISYILFAASVVFLAAAVVMFFKFDMRRIYKILKSADNTQIAAHKAAAKTAAVTGGSKGSGAVKDLDFHMITMPLPESRMPGQDSAQEYEQTLPLGTIKFMLIQDITYTHDSANRLV